jgi:hypothetical protein
VVAIAHSLLDFVGNKFTSTRIGEETFWIGSSSSGTITVFHLLGVVWMRHKSLQEILFFGIGIYKHQNIIPTCLILNLFDSLDPSLDIASKPEESLLERVH